MGDNKCLQTNILRIHRQCRTQRNVHIHVHVPSFLFTSSAMRPPIHPVFPPKIRTFVMGAGSVEEDIVGTGSMRLMKRAVSAMAQWHGQRSLIISSSYQRKARGHAVPFSNAKRLVCHASVDPCPSTTAPLTAHQSHITNAKRYRSI